MACLVNLFKLGFIWISLVHWSHWGGRLGVGPGFVLWGFLMAFFLFLGCEIGIFLVSQTFVRRFGGMSVGVWYWIWSLLYGGTLTYE